MFSQACINFQKELDQARDKNLRLVCILSDDGFDTSFMLYSDNDRRILNNKLQSLERAFIFPDGLPNRPFYK